VIQTGGRCTYIYIYVLTNSSVNFRQSYWQSQAGIGGQAEGYRCQEPPQACQSASQDKGQICQDSGRAVKWIRNLNPGLHTEHWGVIGKQYEPKGQSLILRIDLDSPTAIKSTGYKIFTGLSQGTIEVIKYPEAQHQKEIGV
jgi:hypothetical protein